MEVQCLSAATWWCYLPGASATNTHTVHTQWWVRERAHASLATWWTRGRGEALPHLLPFTPPGKNRQIKPQLWWEKPSEEVWKQAEGGIESRRRATKWIVLLQIQFLIAGGMEAGEGRVEAEGEQSKERGIERGRGGGGSWRYHV